MKQKKYVCTIHKIMAVIAVAYNDIPRHERYIQDKEWLEDIFNVIFEDLTNDETYMPHELQEFYFALGNKDKTRIKKAVERIKKRI